MIWLIGKHPKTFSVIVIVSIIFSIIIGIIIKNKIKCALMGIGMEFDDLKEDDCE